MALALTPSGAVRPERNPTGVGVVDADVAKALSQALSRGTGEGLLHLGLMHPSDALPHTLAFWRDFATLFLSRLCMMPELEEQREDARVPIPDDELAAWAAGVPPMQGAELLTSDVQRHLWHAMNDAFRDEITAFKGSVTEYLRSRNPVWNLVGRVCFHLAENKNDATHPFAFLATYATRPGKGARVQHRPLGQALEEHARNRQALLALLSPLERAARESAVVRELVSSRQVYHPLAWTPSDAYQFLRDVPAMESAGLVVRVPDWWKPRNPSRVQVQVKVGGSVPSTLGLEALLDFSVDVALDGQKLTRAEWASIRKAGAGLVLLRGRWVEVDSERLQQVLEHWEDVKEQAGDGVSFLEAMRLLAGAQIDGERAPPAETPEWSRVTSGPWLRELLEGARNPESLAAVRPGRELKGTLRHYQETGLRWLWLLNRMGLGACLADDMGLGKTIQVLALLLLQRAHGARAPSLLVVPASLVANWVDEARKFAPGLAVRVAHSSVVDRELAVEDARKLKGVDAVITTYGMVRDGFGADQDWDTLVLDEAQAIKNPGAKQTRAVKALHARARVALTGTPVENRLGDLWSIFDFLNPGLLGSQKSFSAFAKRLDAANSPEHYAPLRQLVRPYLLRRLKTDKQVITDLPEKTEVNAWCTLSQRQAALYQQSVEELARGLREVEGMKRRGLVLAFLTRFKQICNHPSHWLQDGAYGTGDSGKFLRLRELAEQVAARQEKVLVFTQFKEMVEPLHGQLAEVFQAPGLVLHGDTPVRQRKERVDAFQSDDGPGFFVLSLKAGGTGLNLTAASHVVHFDRWWNPAVENQATDRAFRIGQKKNVLVHKFICRGTVEERIDELIASKRSLAAAVVEDGGAPALTELSNDEILRLVALDLESATAGE
ncbi:MAG: DEAD/DEAH box helicase [Myxococcota bacterium]